MFTYRHNKQPYLIIELIKKNLLYLELSFNRYILNDLGVLTAFYLVHIVGFKLGI